MYTIVLIILLLWKVNKYKYEIEKVNKEIQEVTRKYNEHKRRMQIEKEYYNNQALLE